MSTRPAVDPAGPSGSSTRREYPAPVTDDALCPGRGPEPGMGVRGGTWPHCGSTWRGLGGAAHRSVVRPVRAGYDAGWAGSCCAPICAGCCHRRAGRGRRPGVVRLRSARSGAARLLRARLERPAWAWVWQEGGHLPAGRCSVLAGKPVSLRGSPAVMSETGWGDAGAALLEGVVTARLASRKGRWRQSSAAFRRRAASFDLTVLAAAFGAVRLRRRLPARTAHIDEGCARAAVTAPVVPVADRRRRRAGGCRRRRC